MKSMQARRQLLQRLEREARDAPGRYRLKLGLLALLGYAVIGLSLLLTLGMTVFLLLYLAIVRPAVEPAIAVPLIMLGILGVVLLRALWVRFDLPAGHVLQEHEAPALQREVERIRAQVGAAPLHGLILNAELNAAAVFMPNGVGTWRQRHYLVLGLPLMQLLDRDELAAVIAHEFGHFHGGHGRFSGWVYRLRVSWYRVMQGLAATPSSAGHLFWLFLRWYAPYFDAYSQVLAREQEHEADAVAAEVAGREPAARALARIALAADWLERDFWPEVHLAEQVQAYPPVQVYARLATGLRQHGQGRGALPPWLLDREPALEDSHPTLRQRLQALGAEPGLESVAPANASAADALLGQALVETLEQRFSLEWRQANEVQWRSNHQQRLGEARRLAELEARAALTAAEAVELAGLIERHRPGADPLPVYLEALERLPSHALGQQRLGLLLLARKRYPEAVQRLHRAIELDPALSGPILYELESHARGKPREAAVHTDLQRLRDRYAAAALDPAVIAEDGDAEELSPHQLDPAQLQALQRSLAGFGKITGVWLVRKRSAGMSALPHYLVLVHWAGSVASENAALEQLGGKLRLPGSFKLLSTSAGGALAKRLRQAQGARVV